MPGHQAVESVRTRRYQSVLCCFFLAFILSSAGAADLRVGFDPVAFDSFQHEISTGQRCSLTRLDFILSAIALKKTDGTWIQQEDWTAYLSLRESRDGFTIKGVPAGAYTALRFLVGVRPELNAADASKHPANHPLNPTVNTLWWGWQGGFVFLAIEGAWRRADGSASGYSFHIATDQNLMTVELPVELDLTRDTSMKVRLDPLRILEGVTLSDERNSTHSRDDDGLAQKLAANIEKSFSITEVKSHTRAEDGKEKPGVILPPGEKLRPFTFSAQFPHPTLPGDNPMTEEGIALGKALFHDRRLSINDTQSCADCHLAQHAFTDPRALSPGAEGRVGTRNAMPHFNLAWKRRFFWDGRAASLREQVLMPIQDPVEMHETLPRVAEKTGVSTNRMARVLEQFLLTLVSDDSRLDRVMRGQASFTPAEQRGFALFHTEFDPVRGQRGADCFHCHGGPLFQNVAFANNGLDSHFKDEGLSAVTKKDGDRGKLAVPSLRNVALTAPYMHDGRFATLEDVVDHYDHGLKRSDTLDPNLAKHPAEGLGLGAEDKAALVAFLKTLTDERFARKRE